MGGRRPEALDPDTQETLRRLADEAGRATAPLMEVVSKIARTPVIDAVQLEKLRTVATLPAVESVRTLGEQLAHIRENMLEALASVRMPLDTPTSIQVAKPLESYIVEAQYETIDVIQKMGSLLEQSLEVQGKQTEVLQAVQRSADQQTRLTRWVLGFAILSCLMAAAIVTVALLA